MISATTFRNSGPGSLPRRARTLLWAGFGGLLLLMLIFGASAVSFLYQIDIKQERIRQDYVEHDRTLEKLRSSIFLSGTYIRDFLLDTDDAVAAADRAQFIAARDQVQARLDDYRRLLRPQEQATFRQLRRDLTDYLADVAPALNWSASERRAHGPTLIQEKVLPRRQMAIGLADRIQDMGQKQLEVSSAAVSDLFASFRERLVILLLLTLAIGVLLVSVTLWRLFRIEDESQARFREILKARGELERLSAELVSAQENERRRISRELHDEVGQVLSAMMLGLGGLQSSMRANNTAEAFRHLQSVQDMTERSVTLVRNLSLLLRPTMLDDLGLVPALNWLAREFTRTTALQVDVATVDCPDDLSEEHRTCIFRVVQEAVRNASRHSGAHHARIYIKQEGGRLSVSVQDDGSGFDPQQETGLGILGMEERVVHLGGTLRVESQRGRGSIVRFDLPLADVSEPAPDGARQAQETSPFRTA
jgi:signal transduction histidine kinase